MKDKIDELLKENMSPECFDLYYKLHIPLDQLTSSSGKFHQRLNGSIPTQGEHIYNMLGTAIKMKQTLDINFDLVLIAIVIHDIFKYGYFGLREKSNYEHDRMGADAIKESSMVFKGVFNGDEVRMLENAVRFHMGRFSNDFQDYSQMSPLAWFLFFLDMGDTNNAIKGD